MKEPALLLLLSTAAVAATSTRVQSSSRAQPAHTLVDTQHQSIPPHPSIYSAHPFLLLSLFHSFCHLPTTSSNRLHPSITEPTNYCCYYYYQQID